MNTNFSESKLRVAVFVRNPNAGGGIQIFAKELAERLPGDIEMCFISKKKISELSKGISLLSESCIKNFKFNLRSFDIILMHQFSIKFYLIARLANRPIIVVSHIWDMKKQDFKSVSNRQIKKLLLRDRKLNLIFVSESVKHNLGLRGEVIPNRSPFSRIISNHDVAKKDLLFVGRFTVEKGVHVFLEIVKYLNISNYHPVSATMIGEGPEIRNLEKSIIDLNLREQVKLVPWISREALKKIYIEHRILIVPSIWDEPYGLVAAEGMSLGLKVFCSNRPGLIEATLNRAIYFDPSSITSVIPLIKNELERVPEPRNENCNDLSLELDFSRTVEQYYNLFHKIRSE